MKFCHKYVSLVHDHPQDFITCQWQRNKDRLSTPYLIYRWVVTLYFIFAVNYALALEEKTALKWFIQFYNLNICICATSAFWCSMLFSKYQLSVRSDDMDQSIVALKILSSYRFYWWANGLATNAVILTVISRLVAANWQVRYELHLAADYIFTKVDEREDNNYWLYAAEWMNVAVVVVDFMMVSHGVRVFHFVYLLLYITLYAVFTVIYWACGGTDNVGHNYIYPMMRWGDNPVGALKSCGIILGLSVIVHLSIWLMHFIRRGIDKFAIRPLYMKLEARSSHRLQNVFRRRYSSQIVGLGK